MDNINKNIKLNFGRLSGDLYAINNIWQRETYAWAGDWEGRALLSFVCHYSISGEKIACMDDLVASLQEHVNDYGYLGNVYNGEYIDEQQLSGHSWLLRGLCAYYETFACNYAKDTAKTIVENLFLPIEQNYNEYPIVKRDVGGVSGNSLSVVDGWKLSSDIGCAFMAIDGLSHYFRLTKDERVGKMLRTMIQKFCGLDFVSIHTQTHATLSAVRGILCFYECVKEKKLLDSAIEIFNTYINYGMTLTYENYNWFGREESWTEPCAVVDSFIVALKLYELTGDEKYKTLLRRIWFNGLQFCLRSNGGAGPNTCVTEKAPFLKILMFEAPFCCTMRYAEGLLYASKNNALIKKERTGQYISDKYGRRFDGDEMIIEDAFGKQLYLSDICGTATENESVEYKVLM